MGHEELALPMLLHGAPGPNGEPGLGGHRLVLNREFVPDELGDTAVAGYRAGVSGGGPRAIDFRQLFVSGGWIQDWSRVPEIVEVLSHLDRAFAYFVEASPAPFQDGFLRRCRLVARDVLPTIHPDLDAELETTQPASAYRAVAEFLDDNNRVPKFFPVPSLGYYGSGDFRGRYGDEEQFDTGFVIWIEGPGILRVWTRMVYLPK